MEDPKMAKNDKNWVDYKEIKRTVTMEMILEHYGFLSELKNSGKNLSGCCPIHKGSNPRQFSVSTEKNIWNCFGNCKTGGNILDFVALVEFENKEMESIRKAALLLKDWFLSDNAPELKNQPTPPVEGKKLVRKEKQSTAEKTSKEEKKPEKPDSQATPPVNPPLTFRLKSLSQDHPFFGQRGILPQTVNDFGLGFCTKGMMKDRIAIPIHDDQGNLVAYCGRAITDEQIENECKYKLPPNFIKQAVVYNLHRQPPKADLFILVESYFSVFALHQADYPNALSLMGSFLSEAQEELIIGKLAPDGKLLLFFDNDEDGQKCADDCLQRFSKRVFVKVLEVGIFGKKPHRLNQEDLRILIG